MHLNQNQKTVLYSILFILSLFLQILNSYIFSVCYIKKQGSSVIAL